MVGAQSRVEWNEAWEGSEEEKTFLVVTPKRKTGRKQESYGILGSNFVTFIS